MEGPWATLGVTLGAQRGTTERTFEKKLQKAKACHAILAKKEAPGAPRDTKMEPKWEQNMRKKRSGKNTLKNVDFGPYRTSFLSIFGVFFSARTLENIPRTGFRPKRATSSSHGNYTGFSLKIKIRDGRPKTIFGRICDGNVIENETDNKLGKITEKGGKIIDFGSIFGRKMEVK